LLARFSLADEWRNTIPRRVKVDNDANAAVSRISVGRWPRVSQRVLRDDGTGIGTGIVLDGKIFHGRTALPRKVVTFRSTSNGPVCNCGKKGCIEVLASGTAIARRTRERLAQSPELGAQIMELAAGDPFAIRSEMIGKAAQSNDPLAKEILEQTLEYLAIWLGNTVDLLEPEVIILGGGAGENAPSPFRRNPKANEEMVHQSRYLEIRSCPHTTAKTPASRWRRIVSFHFFTLSFPISLVVLSVEFPRSPARR